jgi:hypothetical protein
VEAKHATTETETMMNARTYGMFGIATLTLALAAPVQAAPDILDGLIILAKQDRSDERDVRRDDRSDERRNLKRDDDDEYGTGYERRKQKRDDRDGDDDRKRRR